MTKDYLLHLFLLIIVQLVGLASAKEIVAFWHIFTGSKFAATYQSIINEQAAMINNTGLYDFLDRIYYTKNGPISNDVALSGDKYQFVKYNGLHGNEILTIKLLYDYCRKHQLPGDPPIKVLYFHNKGSYHSSIQNTQLRQLLNCFALNPHCIPALDRYDTCGMRFSSLPSLHYSGNFWWATCHHVNKLLDPAAAWSNASLLIDAHHYMKLPIPQSLVNASLGLPVNVPYLPFPDEWCTGYGRYFAEVWLGSIPTFKPADCMGSNIDTLYISAYYDIPYHAVYTYCPNHDSSGNKTIFYSQTNRTTLLYGSTNCTLSEFITNTSVFHHGLDATYRRDRKFGRCENMALHRRTVNWYGEPPHLLQRIMGVPNHTVFRFWKYHVIFYSLNNIVYALPNTKTLHALGFQEKDVVNDVPHHKMFVTPEGDPWPSV